MLWAFCSYIYSNYTLTVQECSHSGVTTEVQSSGLWNRVIGRWLAMFRRNLLLLSSRQRKHYVTCIIRNLKTPKMYFSNWSGTLYIESRPCIKRTSHHASYYQCKGSVWRRVTKTVLCVRSMKLTAYFSFANHPNFVTIFKHFIITT
jgi:hypothetical protein